MSARGALRSARQLTLAWLFCAISIPVIILLMAATLGRRKATLGAWCMRTWGRVMLAISGVTMRFDPGAREAIYSRRARVLTFNHSSTLDLFVGAALMPDGGVTIAKKELAYLPLIGQAVLLLDIVRIDRKDHQAATAKLKSLAERVVAQQLSVMIAPEGTRSKDGSLGKFKLGPFHLALQAGVPIVPIVIHGGPRLYPRGALSCAAGEVRIQLLPTVEVVGRPSEDAHALADQVRDGYAKALAAG